MRNLYNKIADTTAAEHQIQALLFYILRDCSRYIPQADQQFARKVYLPSKYLILITGLWELDRGHLSNAVDCLTDPSLTPTFPDEILYTLIKHEKPDDGLAMSYFLTVSPPLSNDKVLKSYFDLLATTNVTEAYIFATQQSEDKRRTLFENLIVNVLSKSDIENRAARAVELVGLPFTPEEESWFEECLLYGQAAQLTNAKDTAIVRRIATNKEPGGVGALDRTRGPVVNDMNWDDLRLSLQKAKS